MEIAICPSHNETIGCFATISDGKCGLVGWLAFYLVKRLSLLISGSGWGTVFYCYLRPLHDSLVTESGCSGNDRAGKLFWGIKNLSSSCFLVSI